MGGGGGARKQVGIGLLYRPDRLNRLAESISWNRFSSSLKAYTVMKWTSRSHVLLVFYCTDQIIFFLSPKDIVQMLSFSIMQQVANDSTKLWLHTPVRSETVIWILNIA